MKLRERVLLIFIMSMVASLATNAFQITLPKNYSKNLGKKREKEAVVLWNELARNEIEATIRTFVEKNPNIGGINIQNASNNLVWIKKEEGGGHRIKLGEWWLLLSEWEITWPPLEKIKWNSAKLIISLSYNLKTKEVDADGTAEIRLYFKLCREGRWLSRKTLHAKFESFDYGEAVWLLPFGGVELRKDFDAKS